MSPRRFFSVAPLGLLGALLAPNAPQPEPPVHDLGAAIATSALTFRDVPSQFSPWCVVLSDGRVLVDDVMRHTVLLLDAGLQLQRVVIDSAPGRENSYKVMSFIMPFRGDSSFFSDGAARTLVVVTPDGSLGRTLPPPPRPVGPPFYRNPYWPVSVGARAIVYRIKRPPFIPGARPTAGETPRQLRVDDSATVVRMDYATRALDTVGAIGLGTTTGYRVTQDSAVQLQIPQTMFAFYDDVVATSDGSIAIFHARTYRVERIDAQGRRTMGPALPYPWQPITDDDRKRIVDSVSLVRHRRFDSLAANRHADSVRTGHAATTTMITTTDDGERITKEVPLAPLKLDWVPTVSDLPDYYPPTPRQAVVADADNNVWIRTAASSPEREVWDVVDAAGQLADRVRTPLHARIVGFAPGGRVLLLVVDGASGHLQMVKTGANGPATNRGR